jgi:hypothetical protein
LRSVDLDYVGSLLGLCDRARPERIAFWRRRSASPSGGEHRCAVSEVRFDEEHLRHRPTARALQMRDDGIRFDPMKPAASDLID